MSLNKPETIKRLQIRTTAAKSSGVYRFCGKMPQKMDGVVIHKTRKSKGGCKVFSSLVDGALSVITFGNLPAKTFIPGRVVYLGPEADVAKIRGDFARFDLAIANGVGRVCRQATTDRQ